MKTIFNFENVRENEVKKTWVKVIAIDSDIFEVVYKYASMKKPDKERFGNENEARYFAIRQMMFLLS